MGQSKQGAYFDNAATTYPKPETVYQFMDEFYRNCGVNVGRGNYEKVATAASIVDETRAALLEMFHCPTKQVLLEPSATESMNIVLRGLDWKDGMNVYVTPFEHNAVTRTLNYISKRYKIRIIELKVNRKSLVYDLEGIRYQFRDVAPQIVVATHASNVCGVVAPLQEIFAAAKEYQAITVADMSQTAGLLDSNLIKMQADYAIFAGHKTLYGPFGISGFFAPPNVPIRPLIYGGTGIESANPLMPDTIPERFEAGSHNIHAIAGLYAALQWISATGIEQIYHVEQENKHRLLCLLAKYPFIHVIKSDGETIGVVSCLFDGYSSDSMGAVLDEQGIACRVGLHCAPSAHRFLGTFPAGTVRFSVGFFTTKNDFQTLESALCYIEENR